MRKSGGGTGGDGNGNTSDHLQNHIHLTNCIHLKNHLHKHTPFEADRATLLRDLLLLQKSRRLRDPSGTPHLIRGGRGSDVAMATPIGFHHPPISRANEVKNWTDDIANRVESQHFESPGYGDDVDAELSCNRQGRQAKTAQVKERRRRFTSARRNRPCISTRDAKTRPQMSAACDCDDGNVNDSSTLPGNRCGLPWNWSRIHHKGKSFLDMAGRSLSKKEVGSSVSDMAIMSDPSSSSSVFGKEALPLLLDASGSQGSIDRAPRIHDYSGELGLFADKQETDSDLASQVNRVRRQCIDRQQHQNLTQKYMPRTFDDLVGQNLVVQALSNAVMTRKIGLLYVFHGPHGTGKTTCARIFARALSCQSSESPKPCGLCDSCIAHEKGKSRNVKEIGPVSKIDYESVIELLENRVASQFGVFIFDECDAMTSDCWSAVLKFIYGVPRRVVVILVCSTLDVLPHVIVSRCQKFFFTKLRDADIMYALQLIASKEDLEIDRDALKLIASRSDGSLRDAEMTLEQLSLLGQKISLCLVQELVGLISDDKLLDLLDFALSADTMNTVRNLRDIMESGIEPLALMSQLATVITDILAGSYDTVIERPTRKFFQRQALSKEGMEKLRQALRTLSEAEKQLRVSSERMTWLTAALLQLAPDQHYTLPDTTTSSDHRPVALNGEDETSTKMNEKLHRGIEDIWWEVLENIKIKSLKEFMYKEAKMVSLSYGADPSVQLKFSSQLTKSVVEQFRSHILKAFEAVLKSPVTIEIRQGSSGGPVPILLRGLELSASEEDHTSNGVRNRAGGGSDIVEVEADSEIECKNSKCKGESDMQNNIGSIFAGYDGGDLSETKQSISVVRRRVSLAQVIKHTDGCEAAAKLEQENLRLEPRSRKLLCWNSPRISRPKLSCLNFRRRKPQSQGNFASCQLVNTTLE